MSNLTYTDANVALNIAFGARSRLDSFVAPDMELLREAQETFPLLAGMSSDLSPDVTDEGTVGMLAAMSAAFSSLSTETSDPFNGIPPDMDDLADVDNLLTAQDSTLKEEVLECTMNEAEDLFSLNISEKEAGFLLGFCLMVRWVEKNIPEDTYETSSQVEGALIDADTPQFDNPGGGIIAAETIGDTALPAYGAEHGNMKALLLNLLQTTDSKVEITAMDDDVLLLLDISDSSVEGIVAAAEGVKALVDVRLQYVSPGPTGKTQLVNVLA